MQDKTYHEGTSSAYSSVLKNPGFLNLWINQILVQFAYNSLNFALILWIFYLTDSNTAIAALLFAVYLPAFLFGVFSGIIVDLADKKKIILTIDLILSFLFAALIPLKMYFPAILVLTFLINSLVQFFLPSESSSLPKLVKKNQLFMANSLFSTTLFTMFLIGFGLSGPMVSFFGIDFVFAIGAGALFLAFVLANKFPSITTKLDADASQLRNAILTKNITDGWEVAKSEVKATMQIIRGRLSVASSLLLLASVQAVVGVLAVLLPSFLERVLQINATNASYIVVIPLGIGMVIGALLLGKIGHLFSRRMIVGRAVLVAGTLLLLVGAAPLLSPAVQHFPKPKPLPFIHQPSLSTVMALGSLLLGMAVVSIIIPSQTVLQESTKEEDRGKIFGVLVALMSGFSLPPILFAGILSDIFGTMPIFIGLGGAISLLGLLILKPDFFFEEAHLPFKFREFLGLGHWEKG